MGKHTPHSGMTAEADGAVWCALIQEHRGVQNKLLRCVVQGCLQYL